MYQRITTHKELLSALHKLKPKHRRILLKSCNNQEINCLCECIHNVLQGKVPLKENTKTKLKKIKNILRNLISKGKSFEYRKNILIQKGGSFLPIILGTILSTLVSCFNKSQ